MPQCELMASCAFLAERASFLPMAARAVMARYCMENHEHCARYMVYKVLGAERVPDQLYPGEIEDAWKLILERDGSKD